MKSAVIGLFFIVFFAAIAFAQQRSVLRLRIVDQNDALIPNVHIRIKQNGKTISEVSQKTPQEFTFSNLAVVNYALEIQAPGFQTMTREIEIKSGKTELTIKLEVAEVVENVEVEQSAQERAVDNAFSNFLTKEQIATLPDDPELLKKVLKQMAGDPNAVIIVDGFTSDKVPQKSQISSIRIVRSSFDAEYHILGGTYINISTRAGNEKFSGSLSSSFNDESLNARNAFSPQRFPEQTKNTLFFLSGPIKKDKASFSLLALDNRNFDGKSINAVLPGGNFHGSTNSTNNSLLISPTVNYNLTKNHAAKISYEFTNSVSKNIGVGDFDLSPRGYDVESGSHQVRFSESGYVGKRFLNELRFQFLVEHSQTIPKSTVATVLVLDSFNSGGSGNKTNSTKNSFLFSDNLLFGYKNHALKVGVDTQFETRGENSAINQNGTFIFSFLDDFRLNRPSLFTQNAAEKHVRLLQLQFGAFIQDDFRIKKNLNFSLGLRYEFQNDVQDKNNFSPRLGLTFSPFKNGKTTFRGGAGIFYNWLETSQLSTILSNDFLQPSETVIINPGFPNPFLSGTSQILPRSFWQRAAKLSTPYVFHTSFSAENRLTKTMFLRTEYVYEKGVHQFRSRNINAPILGVRPNQNYGNITNIESSAFFVRNAFSLGLNGSIGRKVSFYLNYDLSKIINDADGIFSLPSANYNLKLDRSSANNDQRHRFSAALSWEIRKGIRLSGNYFANSPPPYTITTGLDGNNDTNFNDRPFGTKRNSERGKWKNQFDLSFSWSFSFADKNNQDDGKSFSIVTTSTETSSGFDFTDSKKRFSLKFFANAENLLNQTNLLNFVGVQTSQFSGQATSAAAARKITAGLRFNF